MPKDNAPEAEEQDNSRDAAREARQARAKGKVINYAEADPELQKKMDQVMDAIDRAPDSFENIITYGNPPLRTLGEVANDMIKVQGKFNEQVNIMGSALDKLEGGIGNLNLQEFGKKTRELIKGAGGAGVGGLKALTNGLKAFAGKDKKDEDAQFIEDMQKALPEMLFEMIQLVNDIEEVDKGIQQVRKEAEKLGLARVESTREIGVYLGAGPEVLRRYNEEYIKDAQKTFDETGDPEDELYLNEIIKRKDDFADRLLVLEGSRTQAVIAAQQLRQVIETMEDQSKKVQDIIHNSSNEWKAMLAAAGIAGSTLKASQMLKKADDFGDRMHENTMGMIEEAHELTLNSKARGTIDPDKLIEAANRIQHMIEKENQAKENRRHQLEATSEALRNVSDRLLEAADSSKHSRQLEASEKTAEESKKEATSEAPANDDKAAAKPEAAKKRPRHPRPGS